MSPPLQPWPPSWEGGSKGAGHGPVWAGTEVAGLSRRAALKGLAGAGFTLTLGVSAGVSLSACSDAPEGVFMFKSMDAVRQTLAQLRQQPDAWVSTGAWSLGQVLVHAAQSIEYSMDGYPQLKPGWFRHTVGPAALAVFKARGRMSHSLSEPIPGAPSLDAAFALEAAAQRLLAAMDRFEAHTGAFAPHFAYGELGREGYQHAHLMHLNNHWQEVRHSS